MKKLIFIFSLVSLIGNVYLGQRLFFLESKINAALYDIAAVDDTLEKQADALGYIEERLTPPNPNDTDKSGMSFHRLFEDLDENDVSL